MSEKTAHWYLKWIQHFSRYYKATQIKLCTLSDVKNYLADLSLKSNIEAWQVEQARSALFFLYGTCWKMDWAGQIKHINIQEQINRLKTETSPKSLKKAGCIKQFLDYLASKREVAAGTQNQALNALVFLFRHVMELELGDIGWLRHPHCPGTARPCRCFDYHDLHSRVKQAGAGREESGG